MAYTYDAAAPDVVNVTSLITNSVLDYLKMKQDAKLGLTALPTGYPEQPVYLAPVAPWYKQPIVILAGIAVVGTIIYMVAKRKRA